MKIALLTTDNRKPNRADSEAAPHFSTGSDSLVKGFTAMPDVELHVVSCTQQPMHSPEKLADNIWFHSLQVPKIGWLRTFYQGCIRATRRKLKEIRPDVVHGVGTERDGAISAVFSGFPNVVAIQGNMAELARLHRARIGTYGWLAARLENFTLPRAGGVICNSLYTERLVRPRARKTWVIYPGLREMFVDPPPPVGSRAGALVIAGVISPRKRQLELFNVAEELHRRGLKFEFRFAGFMNAPSEPYSRSFLQRIKPMAAVGYARYLGAPSNDEMVRGFDAVAGMVHFPTEEAFGSVVAEGLARELKFFGARVGGIVEITEGVPGVELFASEDWTGLTNAIARWIESGCPPPAGAAALMRERFHPEVFARQHLKVYREALNIRS